MNSSNGSSGSMCSFIDVLLHQEGDGNSLEALFRLAKQTMLEDDCPEMHEVLRLLVQLAVLVLGQSRSNTLKHEAAWFLCNLSATHTQVPTLAASFGAVPLLLKGCKIPEDMSNSTEVELCMTYRWALGNMAQEEEQLALEASALGAIECLLDDLHRLQSFEQRSVTLHSVANIIGHSAIREQVAQREDFVPAILAVPNAEDDGELNRNIMWCLSYYVRAAVNSEYFVSRCPLTSMLTIVLSHVDSWVTRAIASSCAAGDSQRHVLRQKFALAIRLLVEISQCDEGLDLFLEGGLERCTFMRQMLEFFDADVTKSSLNSAELISFVVSNLSAHTAPHSIDVIIDSGLLDALLVYHRKYRSNCMLADHATNTFFIAAHVLNRGTPKQLRTVIGLGAVAALVDTFHCANDLPFQRFILCILLKIWTEMRAEMSLEDFMGGDKKAGPKLMAHLTQWQSLVVTAESAGLKQKIANFLDMLSSE